MNYVLILIISALTILSCAPKKPPIERNHFVLEVPKHETLSTIKIPATLSVRELSVSPGYMGKEIVYRTDGNKIQSDFYNQYFIPPGPMITQSLRTWLSKKQLFNNIISPASHMPADFILEGNIVSIYGDFQDSQNYHAFIQIEFLLLKDLDMDYEIVFNKTYTLRKPIENKSVQSLVNGLNQALGFIFTSLENDLSLQLRHYK